MTIKPSPGPDFVELPAAFPLPQGRFDRWVCYVNLTRKAMDLMWYPVSPTSDGPDFSTEIAPKPLNVQQVIYLQRALAKWRKLRLVPPPLTP